MKHADNKRLGRHRAPKYWQNCKNILAIMSLLLWSTFASPALAIPSLDLVSDSDNTSTVQGLIIDRSTITFDPALTAQGQAVLTWRANIRDNPSGASFTIMRTAFTGGDKSKLADNVTLTVEDGAGALSFVPNSKFVSGTSLSAIATVHDNLGTVVGSGECRFKLKIQVDSKASAGAGTLGTALIITGVLNP